MRRPVFLAAAVLAASLSTVQTQSANALTISLAFVNAPTTDILGVRTTTANYNPYGFTNMTTGQIQSAILTAVTAEYLGYPTGGSSPLPVGTQLNINFVMASSLTAPSNGDRDYFHMAIGTAMNVGGFYGQACYQCVRTARGGPPAIGPAPGSVVGSVLTNVIASLSGLATNNEHRVNLIAGTIAHEIGHSLSLFHPSGRTANPGASPYSLMATGSAPSYMPNSQRILDRAFSYSEFAQLMRSVGLRSIDTGATINTTTETAVVEPGSVGLFLLGSAMIALHSRRRGHAASA